MLKGLGAGVVLCSVIAAAIAVAPAIRAQEASQTQQAAQDAGQTPGPDPAQSPPTNVSFNDPGLTLTVRDSQGARFASTTPAPTGGPASHQVEMQFSASGDRAGVPLDVAIAHRDTLDADETGRNQHGSELRIGHNLVPHEEAGRSRGSSVYAFISSDDQAVTWRPGQASSLAMQDHRVEVGDHAAGVTYETHGVQTSLAYVQRKVSTRVGVRGYSTDESFAGVTVTVRR
jgi:hypothetical protein